MTWWLNLVGALTTGAIAYYAFPRPTGSQLVRGGFDERRHSRDRIDFATVQAVVFVSAMTVARVLGWF